VRDGQTHGRTFPQELPLLYHPILTTPPLENPPSLAGQMVSSSFGSGPVFLARHTYAGSCFAIMMIYERKSFFAQCGFSGWSNGGVSGLGLHFEDLFRPKVCNSFQFRFRLLQTFSSHSAGSFNLKTNAPLVRLFPVRIGIRPLFDLTSFREKVWAEQLAAD